MVERDIGIGGADEVPRPSQSEIKQRIDGAWRSLMEVLKESPERAISEFIEYSKSANIRRFSFLNQFFLYAQSGGKARFVLTKRAWKRLGRTVKAGGKLCALARFCGVRRETRAWSTTHQESGLRPGGMSAWSTQDIS